MQTNFETLKDSKWLAQRLGISYDKARSLGRENLVPNIRIGKLIKYDPSHESGEVRMISKNQVHTIISWLEQQTGRVEFGEVSVKLIIHQGAVKRVEKGVIDREQD